MVRTAPPIAIIYARFSPRRNAELCESIDVQREFCEAYCIKHGYDISPQRFFYDEALSGGDMDRPGLWAAIAAMKTGRVLVVYKSDRLARDVLLNEIIYREVKKKRGRIEVVEGVVSNGDDPESTLVRQMFAAFDQYLRLVNAARTKAAMLRHQKMGRAMSAVPPYGQREGEPVEVMVSGVPTLRRTLVPDEEEESNIALILSLRRGGASLPGIKKTLEQMRVKCRGKDRWNTSLIHKIVCRSGLDGDMDG